MMKTITRQFSFGENLRFNHNLQFKKFILITKGDYKCFVVMRCWHPRAYEVVKQVKKYNPDEIILLPLYPQYSASTSGSSIEEWKDICKKENYKVKTKIVCCYPTESNFLESHVNLIKKTLKTLDNKNFKLIFSAHGLPENKIKKGTKVPVLLISENI